MASQRGAPLVDAFSEDAAVRRPALVFLVVSAWTVGGLWLDSRVGGTGQFALGVLTAGVLAAVLCFQPSTVRVQALAVVAIATLGEVVGSLIWGLYGYRLENLPAFVPPGHGLVYLGGLALAALARGRPNALLGASAGGALVWGIAGITVLPASDVVGAVGCAFLIGVLAWTRRTVYAGVFVVVAGLELYGTALGTWTWEAAVPGLGLSQGNPPSGAASGYVVFDVVALALVARLSGVGASLRSRRVPNAGPAASLLLESARAPGGHSQDSWPRRSGRGGKVPRIVSRTRILAFLTAALCAAAVALPAAAGPRRADAGSGEVAIFYYPWYSTPLRDGRWAHWYVEQEGAPVLSTPYFPSRGLYSSSNAKIVAAQMREIAAAGVDTVVVSWWGFDSPEHERLSLVAQAAKRQGLAVAVHVEPYHARTPARAAEDIARLHMEGGHTDFYVYDGDRDPAADWASALAPLDDVRIFGHTALVGRAKASGFDGLYTYDVVTWNGALFKRLCTQAHTAGLLCAPSVGPGYDARLATRHDVVRPRQQGVTYDRMWKTAIRADADLVTITSYNEWQEGTQIEPARLQVGRPSYEGAWGKNGVAAQRAYLAATSAWIARLRAAARQ